MVPVGSYRFDLDIADTPELQHKGLGGRSSLTDDHGMIFPYSEAGVQCFWMKDMRISIDIIWVTSDKKVGHIEKSIAPETYPKTYCPEVDAQYVIELSSGMANKADLQIGDTLAIDL
jgi:uncharacterized membrane protein (UPF0127 family)